MLLIGLMSVVDTLNLSIRVSAVVTKRLAVALSLFNMLMILSRTSNLVQAPIVASMADVAVKEYSSMWLLPKLRWIIFSTTLGTMVGAFLTPTFVQIFVRSIRLFEEKKTVPRVVVHLLKPMNFWDLRKDFRFPSWQEFRLHIRQVRRLPWDLLVWHILVIGFYTVGVLSTIYAAVLEPNMRATVTNLSGVVNGIATLLLFIVVDPPAAMITDHCIQEKRPPEDVKTLNTFLILTRFTGTLFAQFLLVPMSHWVLLVARWVFAIFYGHSL